MVKVIEDTNLRVAGFKFFFEEHEAIVKTAAKSSPDLSTDQRSALKSSMGRQQDTYKSLVTREETREEFVKSFVSNAVLAKLIPDQVDEIRILTSEERREAGVKKDEIAFKSIIIEDTQNYEELFQDPDKIRHNVTPDKGSSSENDDWDIDPFASDDWKRSFDNSFSDTDDPSQNGEVEINAEVLDLIKGKERTFLAEAMVGGVDPNIQNHMARTTDLQAFVVDHGRNLANFSSLKVSDEAFELKSENVVGKFFKDFIARINESCEDKLVFDPKKFIEACADLSKISDQEIANIVQKKVAELKEARLDFKDLHFRINEQYVTFKSPDDFGEKMTAGIVNEKRIVSALGIALEKNIDKVPEGKNWQEFFSSKTGRAMLDANQVDLCKPEDAKRLYMNSKSQGAGRSI